MKFNGKTVVVIGASGVVGSGIVRAYLDAGAHVVGVSRSAAKLSKLKQTMAIGPAEAFVEVVADFDDEEAATSAHASIRAALKGAAIDHVVSVQGFVPFAEAPTATPLMEFRRALDDGLFNNYLAATVLLPELKARDGATFTLVSGGLAHIPPPTPKLWLGTVKNAALNALNLALTSETANDKVRVNTMCIHVGVAPRGCNKNQLGMDTEGDTLRLAPAFLGVASGQQKGQIICITSWADADRLAQ
jgi:NAD(P)-dependent dehydrogenase (short-subunit alcohol dehydrogenase family)